MKASIIIPVYNVEKYVAECLKSAISQTYKNIEILLVNDGSTDQSVEKIQPFLSDKRIKLIHQKNQGLSAARNTGIENATGDFVIFLDSDDYLLPETVDSCVSIFTEKPDVDMILYDAKNIYEKQMNSDLFQENYYSRNHLLESTIYPSETIIETLFQKKAYRSSACLYAFKKKGNLPRFDTHLKIHEDELYTPELITSFKKIFYLNQPFYQRRVRENSLMTAKLDLEKRKKIMENLFYLLQKLSVLQKNKQHEFQGIDKIYSAVYQKLIRKIIYDNKAPAVYSKKYIFDKIFRILHISENSKLHVTCNYIIGKFAILFKLYP